MATITRKFPLLKMLQDSDSLSEETVSILEKFATEQPFVEWDIYLTWPSRQAFETFDIQLCHVSSDAVRAVLEVLIISNQFIPADKDYFKRCMEIRDAVIKEEVFWQDNELPQEIWRAYHED